MDYILTNNGAALMTQVAAGRTLLFTRMESGSGYSSSPAMLQSVIDKKQDMFLDEATYENRQAVVKAVLSNMQLEEGYQLRQVGVYAKLEGDEADTLLVIGQQYNGEKIPSYQDGIIQIEYNIAMKVSGTGNVTIDGVGTGYVTKGQFLAHLNDNSNPHKVTAKQVGLEKVPNVDTDDQTPTFEAAVERGNITSGEKLSVIFGKIWKWFADLKGAAFCSVANNLVTLLPGSVLDARQGKELKDQITQLYSDISVRYDAKSKYIQILYNGEWINYKKINLEEPVGLIPVMTSNTFPSGKASATMSNRGEPYRAFDGNNNAYWGAETGGSINVSLEYEFDSTVIVEGFNYTMGNYANKYGAGNVTFYAFYQNSWHEVITTPTPQFGVPVVKFFENPIENVKKVRLHISNPAFLAGSNVYGVTISQFQCIGYR